MLNSAYKIQSHILFNRLRSLEESFVGEYLTGFREGVYVFEVVEKFAYFGTLMTCDNDVSSEVKRCVAAANTTFYCGLRNQLLTILGGVLVRDAFISSV